MLWNSVLNEVGYVARLYLTVTRLFSIKCNGTTPCSRSLIFIVAYLVWIESIKKGNLWLLHINFTDLQRWGIFMNMLWLVLFLVVFFSSSSLKVHRPRVIWTYLIQCDCVLYRNISFWLLMLWLAHHWWFFHNQSSSHISIQASVAGKNLFKTLLTPSYSFPFLQLEQELKNRKEEVSIPHISMKHVTFETRPCWNWLTTPEARVIDCSVLTTTYYMYSSFNLKYANYGFRIIFWTI